MSENRAIPEMKAVQSSNVEAIGHDPASNELHVKFQNGGHYVYAGVDADKHASLMAADSVGKFIHAHIKGKHESTKL